MKDKASREKVVHLNFDDNNVARDLFGPHDENIRSLEKLLEVEIHVRGHDLQIKGAVHDAELGERVLSSLYRLLKSGHPIVGADMESAVRLLAKDKHAKLEDVFATSLFLPARKKVITPRTPSQRQYIESIQSSDLVFGIGPAGTGKTYLAVAVALYCILKKQYRRLVLCRPAVEAGERLGFLPGDMQEKVDPYLRPLYDALYDMLDPEQVERMVANDEIEIAPLAFMRGRTLHNSFVILDEAQNCSAMQMKMCLTRLGMHSKMVVTGDVTQIDLPENQVSGLLDAQRVLDGVEGIVFHYFTEQDVVRHDLVRRVVNAYEKS